MNEKTIILTENDIANLLEFLNRVPYNGLQEAGIVTVIIQKIAKPSELSPIIANKPEIE